MARVQIPTSIINKRNRFVRVNNHINEMGENALWNICGSYEQYLKYGTKNVFENACRTSDIEPDDFIFWYNYDPYRN